MPVTDLPFPRYTDHDPRVPVWCATPGRGGCYHRFFDTSPISPSGRFLAVTRMPAALASRATSVPMPPNPTTSMVLPRRRTNESHPAISERRHSPADWASRAR